MKTGGEPSALAAFFELLFLKEFGLGRRTVAPIEDHCGYLI